MLNFMQWLETTRASVAFHESIWSFPIVESVHVLSLCLFLGMAVLTDLRLLGVALRDVPVSEVFKRVLPWTTVGAVIMVASGVFLFLNTPVRYYTNIFLRVKFVMLFLAVLNVWVFHSGIYRKVARWDHQNPDAAVRQVRRHAVARALGRDCRRGPDDRVQLVRQALSGGPRAGTSTLDARTRRSRPRTLDGDRS